MLVSILIPCYNAERWIGQAIESALSQTWREKEIVVVDDGSTDASPRIIQSFGDRISWASGPNLGGNSARNRLLDRARGVWLQYLDADDYLLPDKIEQQMSYLEASPETDVVFGPSIIEYVAPDDVVTKELRPIPEPHDPWVLLARWYLPQTGAPLWRAQAIKDVGGWNVGQPCCQEHELYLRLLMSGKRFSFWPHAGSVYRQWSEDTVCKRDKPEVRRRRLDIERQAESFLRDHDQLTGPRLWAINQARFEIARSTWAEDRSASEAIVDTIRSSQPGFQPSGAAAPPRYRLLFRMLGFRAAERIATLSRKTTSALRH